MGVCVTAVITPLACERVNNQRYIDEARARGEQPPEFREWHNVKFVSKRTEKVGETVVETTAVETVKCFAGELATGKPIPVVMEFDAYHMNGRTGLSSKILEVTNLKAD